MSTITCVSLTTEGQGRPYGAALPIWKEETLASTTDGFVRSPNWLIDDSNLTLHELVVYTVLLRFRDPKTGRCFPGMTTIADRARISRKSVERAIPALDVPGQDVGAVRLIGGVPMAEWMRRVLYRSMNGASAAARAALVSKGCR
ncbi:hypothetical protein HMPREF1529_02692 [Microbacterium sp. oral taxon 186 str. F0373]|nr:hypothetical protein HMPREF1529_02692 [Microbacterium sp. oral taxon 186 str. F0373]